MQSQEFASFQRKLKTVRGASGKEYLVDEAGRIIDPETGIIYDPNLGVLLDPNSGLSLDLTTGTLMTLDVAGAAPPEQVGRIPLGQVYGIQPITPVTPQTRKTTRLKMLAKEFARFMDKVSGINSEYDLPRRIEYTLNHLDEEFEFIQRVLLALYDYSQKTTAPSTNQFIRMYFDDATPAEKEKIIYLLRYLFDGKVIPPKGTV